MSAIEPTPGAEPTTAGNGVPRPTAPRRGRRLERIAEYRREALDQPDALRANLGVINADLMKIVGQLLRATDRALLGSARPEEDFRRLLPTIEVCLRLTRQVDRLAQLDGRLRCSSSPGRTPGSPAGPGPGPGAARGEEAAG